MFPQLPSPLHLKAPRTSLHLLRRPYFPNTFNHAQGIHGWWIHWLSFGAPGCVSLTCGLTIHTQLPKPLHCCCVVLTRISLCTYETISLTRQKSLSICSGVLISAPSLLHVPRSMVCSIVIAYLGPTRLPCPCPHRASNRTTWSLHALDDGWYIGPTIDFYCCYWYCLLIPSKVKLKLTYNALFKTAELHVELHSMACR